MSNAASIAGPGIAEGAAAQDVHAQMDRRISVVETSVDGLVAAVERVELEAREGQAKLEGKLDQQTVQILGKIDRLGTAQAASRETNWGVLIGAAAVTLTIVGAIGAAWCGPIKAAQTEDHALLMRTFEMAVRGDERDRVHFRGTATP